MSEHQSLGWHTLSIQVLPFPTLLTFLHSIITEIGGGGGWGWEGKMGQEWWGGKRSGGREKKRRWNRERLSRQGQKRGGRGEEKRRCEREINKRSRRQERRKYDHIFTLCSHSFFGMRPYLEGLHVVGNYSLLHKHVGVLPWWTRTHIHWPQYWLVLKMIRSRLAQGINLEEEKLSRGKKREGWKAQIKHTQMKHC